MGVRWYSPRLGRWISPDSIIPNFRNPQSFNRYSYVNNRPLNLIDPSGHHPMFAASESQIHDVFSGGGGGSGISRATAIALAASLVVVNADDIADEIVKLRDWLAYHISESTGSDNTSTSRAGAAGGSVAFPPNPLDPKRNKEIRERNMQVKRADGSDISDIDFTEQTPEGDVWLIEEKSATWASDPQAWAQDKILSKGKAYVEALQNGCNPSMANTTNIGFRFTGGPLQPDLMTEVQSALNQLQALYPDYNFLLHIVQ